MNALLAEYPVAILAGGLATRLRPITEKIPKALVPVAGEPFLSHQLRLLYSEGFRSAVLCVGYLGEMVEEEFGDGSDWGIHLQYSFDGPKLLGTGGALRKALPMLGDRWVMLYGDSYLCIDYAAPVERFRDSGKLALMTVFENHNAFDRSNVAFADGRILKYDKKSDSPDLRYIDYGLSVFDSRAFADRSETEAFDLADLQQDLVRRGEMAGHLVHNRFFEIGSPSGLAELETLLTQPKTS